MIHIDKINCIIVVLVHLSILTVTKAHHETVNVKIKNGNEIIALNWKRTGQYLANKNLPVWSAKRNEEPRIIPHMFEQVGDFITYHDVAKSSAVVYLTKFNCFFGTIDTRFYIARLPLSDLESDMYYEVGGGYVFAHEDNENARHFHHSPDVWLNNMFTDDQIQYVNSVIDSATAEPPPGALLQHLDQDQRDHDKPSTSAEGTPSGFHQAVHSNIVQERLPELQILYPEILVFITHDVYKTFEKTARQKSFSSLVLYYISYFNAMDMLFAKLATDEIAIRINIAGFVIETEHRVSPRRFWQCHQPNLKRIIYCRNARTMLHSYAKYINTYRDVFAEDSFDFFFISTGNPVRSGDDIMYGKSTSLTNIYKRRTSNHLHENLLGSVVQREQAHGDLVTGTREIARLMGIKTDLTSRECPDDELCYAIMQNRRTHCPNCLVWSDQSRNDLKSYVRSNLNHCFLLNYPRSLFPHGQPVFSLSPEGQCMCYGYPVASMDPFYIMSVPAGSCDKPMQCTYDQNDLRPFPLPIDGTPCGGPSQVCWGKKCVELGPFSHRRK